MAAEVGNGRRLKKLIVRALYGVTTFCTFDGRSPPSFDPVSRPMYG